MEFIIGEFYRIRGKTANGREVDFVARYEGRAMNEYICAMQHRFTTPNGEWRYSDAQMLHFDDVSLIDEDALGLRRNVHYKMTNANGTVLMGEYAGRNSDGYTFYSRGEYTLVRPYAVKYWTFEEICDAEGRR